MSLAEIAVATGRGNNANSRQVGNIIEFIESSWGLNPDGKFNLFPAQRVILKAYYGVPLDDNPYQLDYSKPVPKGHPLHKKENLDHKGYYKFRVPVPDDWRREHITYMSEKQYLEYLYDNKRSNIREVIPGKERSHMYLSIGRRSGKTTISACIAAYETYRLINKGDPHAYYGLPPSNPIQLISVATGREQSGLLYQEVAAHYRRCNFFYPYMANNTQSSAKFQTPKNIADYGSYRENNDARASIKVTFAPCVASSLRGAGNIVVILDEFAFFGDTGDSSADAVWQAVVPSTAAFSPKDTLDPTTPVGPVESKVIAISSPAGKSGMFYEVFQGGFKGGATTENSLCIQAPTWEVNITVPSEFLETEYGRDPAKFDTEFGANFSDRFRGWLDKKEDLLACVNSSLRPRFRGVGRIPYYCGFDIALKGDASALAIGHVEGDRIVCDVVDTIQVGDDRHGDQDRIEFTEIVDWIYDYSKRFYIEEGMFDTHLGIVLEQALEAKGLTQFHMTPKNTQVWESQIFRNFKDLMYEKRLELYNYPRSEDGLKECPYIEELLELQAEMKSRNVTIVQAPRGEDKHDDMSDALVRMVWLATPAAGKNHTVSGAPRMHGQQANPQTARAQIEARRRALAGGSHEMRMKPPGGVDNLFSGVPAGLQQQQRGFFRRGGGRGRG